MATMHIKQRDLTYWTQHRTRIEIELATALYDIYNSNPIKSALQEVVAVAIENLIPLVNPEIEGIMKKEAGLDVWRGNPQTKAGLLQVLNAWKSWSASECADLLRLFGTVLDEIKDNSWKEGKELHRAARVGPDERFRNNPVGQDRARHPESKLSDLKVAPVDVKHSRGGRALIQTIKMGGPTKFWGIGPFRLMAGSIIRKIDVAFGLPEGADISGTTADSIFGISRVMSFAHACDIAMPSVPADILHLLPLVSMISQGHHTVVESATVLTLNGKIQYSIGFYSSLMPTSAASSDLIGPLRAVAQKFEENHFNQPIISFYDPKKQVYAGYMFDKSNRDDMDRFRKMATTGENMLTRFKNIPELVPQEQVVQMMAEFGLSAA